MRVFLFRDEPVLRGLLIVLATYFVFVFFGGSDIRNYGSVSHWLSVLFRIVLFPFVTVLCLRRAPEDKTRLDQPTIIGSPVSCNTGISWMSVYSAGPERKDFPGKTQNGFISGLSHDRVNE
jgi:hypothetical protein